MSVDSNEETGTNALKLVFESHFENLERLVDTVEAFAMRQQLSEDLRDRLLVALSEASTNAMRHGNRFKSGKNVTVEVVREGFEVEVTVQDEGEGYNRETVASPLLPENLFKTSGRGLFLIEELADAVHFEDHGRRVHMIFRESDDEP